MMKKERKSISFYVRKMNDPSRGTIYCRLTISGTPKDFSTGCDCALSKWDAKQYRVTGRSETAISVNDYLEAIEVRLLNIITALTTTGKIITTKTVYDLFINADARKYTVVKSFQHYIDNKRKLKGARGAVESTIERYEITKRHLQQFMIEEYASDDIPLVELDMLFINRLYTFLVGRRGCCHNSSVKYIRNFRTIIRQAVTYDWLHKDPFLALNDWMKSMWIA